MKLINPKVERWECSYTLPEIWSHIARCARTCYQSEPRSNGETDKEFVKRVILRNHSFEEIAESRELQLSLHLSCLEHGTVYLDIPCEESTTNIITFFSHNHYSKRVYTYNSHCFVTTNMRVIIENGLMDILQYMCPPLKYHAIRTTFSIITDIGAARELDRHRSHSISEESTRFCNYSKDKFGNELTFIKPNWLDVKTGSYDEKQYSDDNYYTDYSPEYSYMIHLFTVEATYKRLIKDGWTPQQARQVLPLNTKVQTIHTAFNDDWDEFIKLRADACSGSVHPNMKVIADNIKDLMSKANATN